MNVISNIKMGGAPIGGLGDGEAIWHADMTYVDSPPKGAILHALEVPPAGGDTYWANMYLAYETLPPELKKKIEGRKAVHDATYNSAGLPRRDSFDPNARRLMHRTQIKADRPHV